MPGTTDDIEAMTVAFAREQDFAGAISEITQKPVTWVLERMGETHGNTRVMRAFKDRWPDDAALGALKVAQCLRLSLVAQLARTLAQSPEEVRRQLTAAAHETRLRTLFSADWPAG